MIHLAKPLIRAALCAALFGSASAQAVVFNYDFSGVTDASPGSLPSAAYSGSVSFDDAGLAGSVNDGQAALSALSFTFRSNTFTLADAASAHAEFVAGVFAGLHVSVTAFDPNFTLVGGATDTSDAYFAYVPNVGASGFGSLAYTVSTNAAPEPFGLALFGVGWAAMRVVRRKPVSV